MKYTSAINRNYDTVIKIKLRIKKMNHLRPSHPPNEQVIVNTPLAENENQQQNTLDENEPVNNPPVENQPNTFGLTDEGLFEQDM